MIKIDFDGKKNKAILSGDHFDEIRENFSVKNKAAVFLKRYARYIPSRTYSITPTGRFDPCLTPELQKFFLEKQYSCSVEISEDIKNIIKPALFTWKKNANFSDIPYKLKLDLRDYQEEIVKQCLSSGRGTVVLATAGGKTLVMASLISSVYRFNNSKFKCLLIVPDRGLVEQTYNDFVQYGVPFSFSKWTGDNKLDLTSNIIIANLGILQSKNSNLSWLENIDMVVVDEVHKIRKGNEVNKLLALAKTAHKFGFTGTLPEEKEDQWNIIGKIGPILYEKNSYELRTENYVSNANIQMLNVFYKTVPKRESSNFNPTDFYKKELDFIIENKFRNVLLSRIVNKVEKNVLILIDFIKHGEILESVLKLNCHNKRVFFIRGEVEVEEREKIKNIIETDNNVVVIAISKIFSTGINVKNLHYIVFAGGGKAKIKTVQSIGRGLRLHINKDKLIIFDISDQLYYGIQHTNKRKQIYEKEKIQYYTTDLHEKA
jgi:superfamily II DNA or RNA helicase